MRMSAVVTILSPEDVTGGLHSNPHTRRIWTCGEPSTTSRNWTPATVCADTGFYLGLLHSPQTSREHRTNKTTEANGIRKVQMRRRDGR